MLATREMLELGSLYIDEKNNDARLHYLYVDKEYIVSLNLNAVARVKHYGVVDVPFYIRKSVVDLALKQVKAKSFQLSDSTIVCCDKDGVEIFTIAAKNEILGKFPDIGSAFGKKYGTKVKIVDVNQVSGIFAVNGVLVEKQYIPKKLSVDFQGYVGINSAKEHVVIASKNDDVVLVIAPTVHNYLFDGKGL